MNSVVFCLVAHLQQVQSLAPNDPDRLQAEQRLIRKQHEVDSLLRLEAQKLLQLRLVIYFLLLRIYMGVSFRHLAQAIFQFQIVGGLREIFMLQLYCALVLFSVVLILVI